MSKSKRGAKVKLIDFKELQKLCEMHCTGEEIASFFDISYDTLERRVKECGYQNFAEYYAKNVGKGKVALRRKQWDLAMDGEVKLLVWLGKQNLGQKDKIETENTNYNHEPFLMELEVLNTNAKKHQDDANKKA
jgi:predicted nucleic-acid-binding Zn-ribbon protein